MKKTFRRVIATIFILILATPLISCGKSDKNVPEEVVKTYIGSYLKSNNVDYEKTKVDKTALEDLVIKRDYNISTILGFDGETNEGDFLKSFYSALNKVEFNIKSSNVEKDSAKVNIEIKGINLDSLKNNSYKSLLEEKKNKNKKMNIKESKEYLRNNIIDSLNNINLDESKTLELTLDKNSNNEWQLNDDSLAKIESTITERNSYERLSREVPDAFKELVKQES